MPKSSKKRQQYTAAQRKRILAVAQRGSLTAIEVKQRFGVVPVTYYSWRKKAKLPALARGRRPGNRSPERRPRLSGPMQGQLRGEVRRRVQAIVLDEVRRVLAELR
jgi:transposase-like protein